MAGGVTVLTTSPRVAPGLLSAPAWRLLRGSGAVLTADPGHPQRSSLTEEGIDCRVVPAADAVAEVNRLVRAGVDVVWLAEPGAGREPLPESVAGTDVAVRAGAVDLPGGRILDLVRVMDRLRAECPWDREQTHASLARYLLEEAYEAVDAIEAGDLGHLREELGDVLLQVVFHAKVASESGAFTVDDVADTVVAKMVRRHPHVFAGIEVSGAGDVLANWDTIKSAERAAASGDAASVLDGVPFGQPALALAAALRRRASRAGVPDDLLAADGTGVGARLFDLAAADADPESALRAAARAVAGRVRAAESAARTAGHDPATLTPAQWRTYWPA